MIIFLHGQDSYRSKRKLEEIVSHYKKVYPGRLNIAIFDFSQKEKSGAFEDLRSEFFQQPLFSGKKLFVVKNLSANPVLSDKFLKTAENFLKSKDIIVFQEQRKLDGKTALLKFFQENARCQEFELLQGSQLKNWLKKEFQSFGAEPEPEAVTRLAEYVGSNLWQMSQEIRKLANYCRGRQISQKDVDLLVKPKIEADIFKTIDFIGQKNKKQAFDFLQRHLEFGDSPIYLLSMINFQFRNLLIVREMLEQKKPYSLILQKSGLHPFVVKKAYWQAQKFTFSELEKIYQKIFQIDLGIKTGKIEPELALELLIAEI